MLAIYQVLAAFALIMGFIGQYRSIFHDRWNLYHHDLDSPEPVVRSCTSTAMILPEIYHSLSGPRPFVTRVNFSPYEITTLARYRHAIIDRFSETFASSRCNLYSIHYRACTYAPPPITIVSSKSLIFKFDLLNNLIRYIIKCTYLLSLWSYFYLLHTYN